MGGGEEVARDCGIPVECERVIPGWLIALDNAPTAVMIALGTALLWLTWWPLAAAFLVYSGLSIVLFWRLICPYCHHYDTRACPCGYGAVAPRFFERRGGLEFRAVFKQRIVIMFPVCIVQAQACFLQSSSSGRSSHGPWRVCSRRSASSASR